MAFSWQTEQPVIDTINKTIKVKLSHKANTKNVGAGYYISPGATADFESGVNLDFSSGSRKVKITSESGKVTAEWTISIEVAVSDLKDNLLNSKLQTFPNPAVNYCIISAGDNEITRADLIDITGRTVLTQSNKGTEILLNRGNLSAGTFLVRAYTTKGVLTGKVLFR